MDTDDLNNLVAAILIPAIVLDSEFRILAANRPSRALFDSKLQGLDFVRIVRQPGALECLANVIKVRKPVQCKLVLHQQTPRTFLANAAPLSDPSIEVEHILFTLQDISDRIDAEKARSAFVANVSHELRSPLTSLLGAVETLKGPARNDPKARERFLDLMQNEAERMSRLVADLLSLSKLEAKEHLPPKTRIDLLKIIQKVEQSLAASRSEYAGRVEIQAPAPLPMIRGDQDQMTEVFQNLIENALKYSKPDTPVLLKITHEFKPKNQLTVHIEDQGEGIAPEHIPRLTERFYRVDKGRSRQTGGTGLGLAITKHILNRHRARLTISSQLAKGTTISVRLKV
ncbi:MAG: hypothetical protein COA47_08895 [Robiginitomaculum sp.]|nr:MAG: hypothetical protein COA47_08895 [Robiginitomaculum sp.]